jgi:hypothetical protein
MRPAIAVPVLLAACLVASVATAQNDKITAQFESLAASGVVGDVTINPMPNGEIQLHSTLKGLVPSTDYTVFVFDQNATCGEGTSSVQIVTFRSNPAGIANWNEKVALPLASVQSIGIRQAPANTLVACASVPQ